MNWAIGGLGVFLLIAGAFLVFYTRTSTQSIFGVTLLTGVEYPYRNYGYVLLFAGLLSLVLGLLMIKESHSSADERKRAVLGITT